MSAQNPGDEQAVALLVDGPGRRFQGVRKVRLGDVTTTGRLRLDALTRYTQDVSDDDTTDAGLGAEVGWVVRRTSVVVDRPARFGDELTFTTWCSGLGRRWAERSLDIRGGDGACYRVTTLWIALDPVSGRPAALTEQFLDLYGPAAAGRTVQARLSNPRFEPGGPRWSWPLRAVDLDTLGHVNNAAYWAVVEEHLRRRAPDPEVAPSGPGAAHPLDEAPGEGVIEYSAGLAPDDEVTVHEGEAADEGRGPGRVLWLTTGDGPPAASVLLRRTR